MHQGVAVQQQRLHRALAGQPDRSFEVPHAVRVVEGLAGVARGQLPAELVDEEETCDEQELTDERGPRYRVGLRFFFRLGAGIHPPAPSLTVVRGWCVAVWLNTASIRRRTDTPVYRYARVPVHWRIDDVRHTMDPRRDTDDVAGRGRAGDDRRIAPLQAHARA
ncbi:hypothetical protein GCM10018783_11180 [Streptomyces griseosporeus]|nr:hypothetical protein GCM10018783_11180 [Streptomyces griseosporeus]